MAPETILSVLSRENPTPRPWNIGPGPNTIVKDWQGIENWKPWPEFNYKKLRSIYKDIVEAPWRNAPDEFELSEFDLTYGDEDGFEHQVLSSEIIRIVNSALRHAQKLYDHRAQLHLGRRGRCHYGEDNRLNPDWVLVNNIDFLPDGKFASIMPGDTKLSARWSSSLNTTDEGWQRPVRQILSYSNDIQCRYGFLITDLELVVFQFAREYVGPGIAKARGIRTPQAAQTHQRVLSDVTQLSESVQAMSISMESTGAQSYVESGMGIEYQDPKYQAIPWENKGNGALTMRLGLFYLCLMAGYGSSDVRTRYPKLNTWWQLANGHFRHNTSGFTKRKLSSKDKMENPDHVVPEEEIADVDYSEAEEMCREGAYPVEQYLEGTRMEGPEGQGRETGDGDGDGDDGEKDDEVRDKKGKQKVKNKEKKSEGGSGKAKPERSLPRLRTKKDIIRVNFQKAENNYYFTSRKKKSVLVKRHEWIAMEYEGHQVMAYKGTDTYYIADKLPDKSQ